MTLDKCLIDCQLAGRRGAHRVEEHAHEALGRAVAGTLDCGGEEDILRVTKGLDVT